MTVRMVMLEDGLHTLDSDRQALSEFKRSLAIGQVVETEFRSDIEDPSDRARRYFHMIRDRYAQRMGYDKEYAKDELMVLRGVAMKLEDAADRPPAWTGHPVTLWGQRYFRKSLREYTKKELTTLIEGTIGACFDNHVDIEDLVDDYKRGQAA